MTAEAPSATSVEPGPTVNAPATSEEPPPTVNVALSSVRSSCDCRLRTETDAPESVTTRLAGTSITTSSVGPGSTSPLQLSRFVQSPSPPPSSHWTTESMVRGSRASMASVVRRRRARRAALTRRRPVREDASGAIGVKLQVR